MTRLTILVILISSELCGVEASPWNFASTGRSVRNSCFWTGWITRTKDSILLKTIQWALFIGYVINLIKTRDRRERSRQAFPMGKKVLKNHGKFPLGTPRTYRYQVKNHVSALSGGSGGFSSMIFPSGRPLSLSLSKMTPILICNWPLSYLLTH